MNDVRLTGLVLTEGGLNFWTTFSANDVTFLSRLQAGIMTVSTTTCILLVEFNRDAIYFGSGICLPVPSWGQVELNEREPQVVGPCCPECDSNLTHRSRHANNFERILLRLIGARPFRCESCEHRFYSRRNPPRNLAS